MLVIDCHGNSSITTNTIKVRHQIVQNNKCYVQEVCFGDIKNQYIRYVNDGSRNMLQLNRGDQTL